MRLPQYHVGFAEISISGDEVYDSVLFNNPTPDSPYMGTDWSTMNVDGFISAAGVVPIGVTKVMKTTLM
jgi:hypothetical protein